MKIFLFTTFIGLSGLSFAEVENTIQNSTTELSFDGSKKSRRHKRIGKKRKRKCKQFAKRKFAGA